MLSLYKALETKVLSDKTSGVEKARCAEIAASIALDVLKLKSEGIRAVKEGLVLTANKNNTNFHNLRNEYNNDHGSEINSHNQQQQHQEQEDDNRKFWLIWFINYVSRIKPNSSIVKKELWP